MLICKAPKGGLYESVSAILIKSVNPPGFRFNKNRLRRFCNFKIDVVDFEITKSASLMLI